MNALTNEQKRRIEENKRKALCLKATNNQGAITSTTSVTAITPSSVSSNRGGSGSANCVSVSPEIKRRIEDNRQKALAKRKDSKLNVTPTKYHSSLTSVTAPAVTEPSISYSLSPEQRQRITENKRKALSNRAERLKNTPNKSTASTATFTSQIEDQSRATCRPTSPPVSVCSHLSPQQKQKIEENRLNALTRKSEKNNTITSCFSESIDKSKTVEYRPRPPAWGSGQMAAQSPGCVITNVKHNEAYTMVTVQTSPPPWLPLASSAITQHPMASATKQCTMSVEEQKTIDENRQRALAKKAQRNLYPALASASVNNNPVPSSVVNNGTDLQLIKPSTSSVPSGVSGVDMALTCQSLANHSNVSPHKDKSKLMGQCITMATDSSRFEVQVGYHPQLVAVFKSMKTARFDSTTKRWSFNLKDYSSLLRSFQSLDHMVEILPLKSTDHRQPDTDTEQEVFVKLHQKPAIKGTCALISSDRFEMKVAYFAPLVEVFKSLGSRQYNSQTKCFSFLIEDYSKLLELVKSHLGDSFIVDPLPSTVVRYFKSLKNSKPLHDKDIVFQDFLPHKLASTLFQFQEEGIRFAICRKGRVLIADDMGLGKTLQAIAVTAYYRAKWPVLVVCPSSLRFLWAQQYETWLPDLKGKVNVVITTTTASGPRPGGLRRSSPVNIISYDMLVRQKDTIQAGQFDVVIADESHFIKNSKSIRTNTVLPICKGASCVILLSGTPCLSRPMELFTQVKAIDGNLFPSFHNFGLRYCDAKQNAYGWDYSGSSNERELQILLKSLMIRRIKADVLDQLPDKQRQVIILDPTSIKVDRAMNASRGLLNTSLKASDRKSCLMKYFSETGQAKAQTVGDYVVDMLESDKKFIVFAHHREVLDTIQQAVNKKKFGFVRIDGSTPASTRHENCEIFQRDDTIRVIILSITAANAGLNLTAANLVLFAELFWNPGILVQAEDRAHRIGQHDSVLIQYLIANKTADDFIWPLIQNKLTVLSKTGLTKDNFSDVVVTSTTCDMPQTKLMRSYFEESFIDDQVTTACASPNPVPSTDGIERFFCNNQQQDDKWDDEPPNKVARLH